MSPEERFDRIETQIEKNTAGIRDLMRLSSIFLEQQKQVMTAFDKGSLEFRQRQERDHEAWTVQVNKLNELHAETEQKLNILIDTVDRIIRNRNGDKQS